MVYFFPVVEDVHDFQVVLVHALQNSFYPLFRLPLFVGLK